MITLYIYVVYGMIKLPTSDLATMSVMFYAIYIGSQSVSEYHTRCASWCSTSSITVNGTAPTYMTGMVTRISDLPGRSRCHLHSAAGLFDVPRTRTVFGSRAGPVAWNGLPAHVRAIRDVIPFKSALKTLFFSISLRYFPLTILSFCGLFLFDVHFIQIRLIKS